MNKVKKKLGLKCSFKLYQNEFGFVWLNQSVEEMNQFLHVFRERLSVARIALPSPTGDRFNVYMTFCTIHDTKTYLKMNIDRLARLAPTRLAQSTSQFKTRMGDIRISTWNMRSNVNSKAQANMHTSRNNQCNPDMQCSNTWKHLIIANQIQRASKTGFYCEVWEN